MLASWSRLSQGKRGVWMGVAGVIVAGTVIKVVYFKLSRQIMVDDSARKHKEGLERLRKAHEFAEWSRNDRESRLPPLTPEQAAQMRHYLQLVEEHGLSKTLDASSQGMDSDAASCPGCPVTGLVQSARTVVSAAAGTK